MYNANQTHIIWFKASQGTGAIPDTDIRKFNCLEHSRFVYMLPRANPEVVRR